MVEIWTIETLAGVEIDRVFGRDRVEAKRNALKSHLVTCEARMRRKLRLRRLGEEEL